MKLSAPLKTLSMRSAHVLEFKPKEWYLLLTDHRDEVDSGLGRFTDAWPVPRAVHGPFPSTDLVHEYRLTHVGRMDMVSSTPHGSFIRKDGDAQTAYAAYIALATPVPERVMAELRQQIADVQASAIGEKVDEETDSPAAFRARRRRGP